MALLVLVHPLMMHHWGWVIRMWHIVTVLTHHMLMHHIRSALIRIVREMKRIHVITRAFLSMVALPRKEVELIVQSEVHCFVFLILFFFSVRIIVASILIGGISF